jgi:excisionase family DNA binding protein
MLREEYRSASEPVVKPFLTIAETASLLRISQSTIRNAINSGRLRAFRFGAGRGAIRISPTDLGDFAAACASGRRPPSASKSATSAAPFKCLKGSRLLGAWRQQGVLADLPDEHSAPSSESSCAPSAQRGS